MRRLLVALASTLVCCMCTGPNVGSCEPAPDCHDLGCYDSFLVTLLQDGYEPTVPGNYTLKVVVPETGERLTVGAGRVSLDEHGDTSCEGVASCDYYLRLTFEIMPTLRTLGFISDEPDSLGLIVTSGGEEIGDALVYPEYLWHECWGQADYAECTGIEYYRALVLLEVGYPPGTDADSD